MELNDQVVVTLTAAGARHLNAFYGYYAKKFPSLVWKTDFKEGDDLKSSLWDILGIFAGYYQAGKEIVFTNLRKE